MVSFEWHDFEATTELDWSQSFHPGSIEICLNLAGEGRIHCDGTDVVYRAGTAGFYCRGKAPLQAARVAGQRHQFLTVEFPASVLSALLSKHAGSLHPLIRRVVSGETSLNGASTAAPLSSRQQLLAASLRKPPVMAAARSLWYQSKALELAVEFFFEPAKEEFFCVRQHRLADERVERVKAILQRNLAEPPSLEAIGREAGCSPFYLSRTFSNRTGMTIPQYLRKIRMERAAQLLKAGTHNVTEAALEVGYNSLSHFSQAFCQTLGTCPAIYAKLKS
jgi:AraC-like DNA-binding protein